MTPHTCLTLLLVLLTAMPAQAQEAFAEEGIASYYGRKFHGRKTANGERFDNTLLTCAHRTLPFGTRLRVTNLENGRTVVVRVTDRGPFRRGRIIDVTYTAAEQLGMVSNGICRVRIEVVPSEVDQWIATQPFLIRTPDSCAHDTAPYATAFTLPRPPLQTLDTLQCPPRELTNAQPKRKRRWLLF